MRNQNTFWVIAGVVIVIILLVLAFLFWPVSDSKSDSNGKPVSTESMIQKKDLQIAKLEAELSGKDALLEEKDNTIALIIKNCEGKTYYKSSGAGNSKPAGNNGSNSGNVKPVNTGNGGGNSGGSTINKEPEAEYLTQQNSVPKSKVRIEINEQKFCIRLGDLFWPHLAVNLGEEFSEIVDNGIGGFDLYILPAGTVGSNPKGYGITEDFTFWIKKSRLTSWPETPYFLNKSGIFVKGQESGEYWIAK